MLYILSRCYRLFFARFATLLPQGRTEFENFCADVLDLYQLPDNNSTRKAIGIMMQNLGPAVDRAPKKYFGVAARKSITNEVIFDFIDGLIKEAKRAKEKAEIDPIAHAAMNKCPEMEAHEKMS